MTEGVPLLRRHPARLEWRAILWTFESHGGGRPRCDNLEWPLQPSWHRRPKRPFDAKLFLESAGLGKRVVAYARRAVVFSQGDPCDHVLYVQSGTIQVSVLSTSGKEAIVVVLGPGEFLGEGALAGHPIRLETATATVASTVLAIPKRQMIRLLHSQHALSVHRAHAAPERPP
jgi:CRP-like cAMP-binding protein